MTDAAAADAVAGAVADPAVAAGAAAAAAAGNGAAAAPASDSLLAQDGAAVKGEHGKAGVLRPDGLADKYWDAEKGEARWGDVLKRHNQLEQHVGSLGQKQGAFFGGLKEGETDYKLNIPEGFSGDVDMESPLLKGFVGPDGLARKLGLSQKGVDELFGLYVKDVATKAAADGDRKAAETRKLGADAETIINDLRDYAKRAFPPEVYEGFLDATSSAAAIKAWQYVLQRSGPGQLPSFRTTPSGQTGITPQTIEAERWKKNEHGGVLYETDPGHRKAVDARYAQFYGNDPEARVIGG
jgi:hypothetical protein